MSAFNFQLPRTHEACAKTLERSSDYRVLRRLPDIGEIWVTWPRDGEVILAILDTETTGLDPAHDQMIELAVTIVGINAEGQLSHIEDPRGWLEQPSGPLTPEIVRVTGLTDADLTGQRFDDWDIAATLQRCDVLVSHNARFDRAFMARRFPGLVDKPWGCTVTDMDWQDHGLGGRALAHLLYEAGYFYHAHRAGPDCWALACLLASQAKDRRSYAGHLIDAVRQPSLRIHANGAPIAIKDHLKGHGYRWDPAERLWWRDITLVDEERERAWLDILCPLIKPTTRTIDAYIRHCG